MRNSPENIDVRRNKIRLLLSFKFPQSEIARQLNVSLRTIVYDIKEIRKEWNTQIKKIDLDQLISELQFELDNRRRELYAIAQAQGTDVKDKISALRALAEENDRLVRLLQSVGKIEKTPDEINANVAYKIITAIPRLNNHEVERSKSVRMSDRSQKRSSNLSVPDAKNSRGKG